MGERLASHHCYLLTAGPQCCVDRLRHPPKADIQNAVGPIINSKFQPLAASALLCRQTFGGAGGGSAKGQKLTSAIADSCQTAARYVRRGRDTRQHIAAKLEGMQYVIPQVHYMNWRAGARLAFPDRTRGG